LSVQARIINIIYNSSIHSILLFYYYLDTPILSFFFFFFSPILPYVLLIEKEYYICLFSVPRVGLKMQMTKEK
jgi:hypothetical protein